MFQLCSSVCFAPFHMILVVRRLQRWLCEKLLEAFPMSNRANASQLQDGPTSGQSQTIRKKIQKFNEPKSNKPNPSRSSWNVVSLYTESSLIPEQSLSKVKAVPAVLQPHYHSIIN